jgi:hypothetical protein
MQINARRRVMTTGRAKWADYTAPQEACREVRGGAENCEPPHTPPRRFVLNFRLKVSLRHAQGDSPYVEPASPIERHPA